MVTSQVQTVIRKPEVTVSVTQSEPVTEIIEEGYDPWIERLATTLMNIAGISTMVFLIIAIIAGDSLLPIWIFVTSLTLLVHTAVFTLEFPKDAFVVLKVMLKLLRLDFWPFELD